MVYLFVGKGGKKGNMARSTKRMQQHINYAPEDIGHI